MTQIIVIAGLVVAALALVAVLFQRARKAGADAVRADAAQRTLNTVAEATHAQIDVAGRTDAQLDDGLRHPGARPKR